MECWDCPVIFGLGLITKLAVFLLILAVSARAGLAASPRVRACGFASLLLAGFLYLFGTVGLLWYGVAFRENRLEANAALGFAVLASWYICSIVAVVALRWLSRRSAANYSERVSSGKVTT